MRHWEIKDGCGRVLHAGHARTRRDFVARLVERGASLAGADFRNDTTTFDRLDLEGADLRGALLDHVSMRAANLKRADLTGASMVDAKLMCAWLENAVLDNADLTEADFTSSIATRARFRGTRIDRANFSKSAASSSLFNYARGRDAVFMDAVLRNANFGDATLISPDFRGADLGHRMLGQQSDAPGDAALSRHFPDRTQGAVVVGGVYDESSHLPPTVAAMRADRRTSRLARMGLWTATSVGMFMAAERASELMAHCGLAPHVGAGAGVVAVIGGVYFLKEIMSEYVRDKMLDRLNDLVRGVRQAFKDLDRMGTHRINLVAAVARGLSAEPLRLALEATAPGAARKGFWHGFKAFWCGLGHVILCDRRHLAAALGVLSANRRKTCNLPHDIVLLRCDCAAQARTHPGSPSVVAFLRDGRSSAIWPLPQGGHARTVYDEQGRLAECLGRDGVETDPVAAGLPAAHVSRLDAAFAFEACLLGQHGMGSFDYPRESHAVLAGRDGSILVQCEANRRLDNPYSHALIRPDGSGLYVRNGAACDERSWSRRNAREQAREPILAPAF